MKNISLSCQSKSGLITRIVTFSEDSGEVLTLHNFLNYYHLNSRTLYQRGRFSRLCVLAGVAEDFQEKGKEVFTKALLRLTSVDSRRFITFLTSIFTDSLQSFTEEENRMLYMFHYTIWQKSPQNCGFDSPYTFLGTANYVSHQGSRPMNITWKLDHPIPAKFLKKTNKLVVN